MQANLHLAVPFLDPEVLGLLQVFLDARLLPPYRMNLEFQLLRQ